MPGTPLDEGGLTPTLEAIPGTPAESISQARELEVEIEAITG
jgi:hypothetical protein